MLDHCAIFHWRSRNAVFIFSDSSEGNMWVIAQCFTGKFKCCSILHDSSAYNVVIIAQCSTGEWQYHLFERQRLKLSRNYRAMFYWRIAKCPSILRDSSAYNAFIILQCFTGESQCPSILSDSGLVLDHGWNIDRSLLAPRLIHVIFNVYFFLHFCQMLPISC